MTDNNTLLPKLLEGMNSEILYKLSQARSVHEHPGIKGDASEGHWHTMLELLPNRYKATSGFIVDSEGNKSEQIDVVIYDRQYTPFIFEDRAGKYIPAEGVYAVFEAKQEATAEYVAYAKSKAASVRRLKRTSLPVPTVNGSASPKPLHHIEAGLLALDTKWNPAIGGTLAKHLEANDKNEQLNFVCVARHGLLIQHAEQVVINSDMAATHFFFHLISVLQSKATVPMLDVMAYARWLR